MFTEAQKDTIFSYFFRKFYCYRKPHETRKFIQRWQQVLHSYTQLPGFICFEPKTPLLKGLQPRSRAVLVVPTHFRAPKYWMRNVSLFTLYAYRIQLLHASEYFQGGLEFLILYLELTGIRLLGFYRLTRQQDFLIPELQEKFPDLKIYGSESYSSFRISLR